MPICRSAMTPCRMVWPWAECAVDAKAGARGNCRREIASCGFVLPASKYHVFRTGAIGRVFGGKPSTCHTCGVSKHTKRTAGNLFQIFVSGSCKSTLLHPITVPRQPRKILRPRSRWSVATTGRPKQRGKTPYRLPHSLSCRCNHRNFSSAISALALSARVLRRSDAIA